MSTNAGTVGNVALQKLVDGVIASIILPDGTYPAAAPNAWKDHQGRQINASDTNEFELVVRTNPDGTAYATVRPVGSKASSLNGPIDTAVLATKLV